MTCPRPRLIMNASILQNLSPLPSFFFFFFFSCHTSGDHVHQSVQGKWATPYCIVPTFVHMVPGLLCMHIGSAGFSRVFRACFIQSFFFPPLFFLGHVAHQLFSVGEVSKLHDQHVIAAWSPCYSTPPTFVHMVPGLFQAYNGSAGFSRVFRLCFIQAIFFFFFFSWSSHWHIWWSCASECPRRTSDILLQCFDFYAHDAGFVMCVSVLFRV